MKTPLSLKWGLLPVALFLLFGAGAAFIVPSDYVGNPRPTPPDEGAHIGYIDYLERHEALPVFRHQNDNYEGHQPPLYYLSSLPAYNLALAVDQSNGELTRPGIVILRLWSVLLAGLGVWVAWLLGRRVFGPDNALSLAPPLLLALWPGRTMIVAAVTNDGLAETLCLLTFLLCLTTLAEGLTPRRSLWIGVAWALALMTKSTSLALGPIVLLALLMRAVTEEPEDQVAALKRALKAIALAAVPVLFLAGWWFVRNQVLYGDPLAARVFEELFTKDRATPEFFLKLGLSGGAYYQLVVINTALSFWGVYGQANVYQTAPYYVAGLLIWLLAATGLVLRALRGRRSVPAQPPGAKKGQAPPVVETTDWTRQAWGLSWLLLAVTIVLFLRFNATFYQAQARYLFSASGPIVLLLTLGLWGLDRKRLGLWAVGLALLVMLLMSLSSVFGFSALEAAHNSPPLLGG